MESKDEFFARWDAYQRAYQRDHEEARLQILQVGQTWSGPRTGARFEGIRVADTDARSPFGTSVWVVGTHTQSPALELLANVSQNPRPDPLWVEAVFGQGLGPQLWSPSGESQETRAEAVARLKREAKALPDVGTPWVSGETKLARQADWDLYLEPVELGSSEDRVLLGTLNGKCGARARPRIPAGSWVHIEQLEDPAAWRVVWQDFSPDEA